MSDLRTAFASLLRHHIATVGQPLPPASPGITWVWAANGIWKRGVNAELDLLVPVERFLEPVPGLAALMPHAIWRNWPARLPGGLLQPLLDHAVRASATQNGVARPIEQQYFFVLRDQLVRLIRPHQDAGAAYVRYAAPPGAMLVDCHSHHSMAAYFSDIDDADDQGLSVSMVIGHIFTAPEVALRLNVYGIHWSIPIEAVFTHAGPFRPARSHRRSPESAHRGGIYRPREVEVRDADADD